MKAVKTAALAAALLLAAARSQADQTNLVQNLGIQLMGVMQGRTFTNGNFVVTSARYVPVDSRRIIAALGNATANTFSPTSRLAVVTPLAGGFASIQVRDGATAVDVTGFFVHENLSDIVHSAYSTGRGHRSVSTDYNLQRLALQDSGGSSLSLHFDVRGFATDTSFGDAPGGVLDIRASGTGDREGSLLILQGDIVVRGQTLEVVSDSGPGPAT